MAKILSVVSRAGLARVLEPPARALLRAGVSPNAVTLAGTVGVCVGAGFATQGYVVTATVIITLSAFTDLIDGTMARARGGNSRFGALLDSSMDRVADGAIFGAATYWLAATHQHRAAIAALLCLVAGQVVSYVKARAEGLGFACNVGIAERAERLILLGVGGLLYAAGLRPALEVALWLLGALSVYTVWQRIRHVYLVDRRATEAATGASPEAATEASPDGRGAPGPGR